VERELRKTLTIPPEEKKREKDIGENEYVKMERVKRFH